MTATISPSVIEGSVTAPAGKSTMQRACALALLNNGITVIHNPGKSNDDLAALRIISQAGATIEKDNGKLIIESAGKPEALQIDCGESGLSLRMFTPIMALFDKETMINAEGSLLKRRIDVFDTVFPLLAVKIITTNGFPPLKIKGPLIPADIELDGSGSSQYLTGFLFALAKAAKTDIRISVSHLKSKPYIDISLDMLQHFGYAVSSRSYKQFDISPKNEERKEIVYYNECDWSAAAFLLVAGAIAGDITVCGLSNDSKQGDRRITDVLRECGADLSVHDQEISVKRTDKLKPFTFDATDCPDLFPPLVALAVYCTGTSVIKGVSRLFTKESNRAVSLTEVFTKMGTDVTVIGDEMRIVGGMIKGGEVDGHHDHRIVMAAAIAGLGSRGEVVINGAEAVDKSYPAFFNDLKMLGAAVSLY